jgi:hypothetical protein
LVRVAPHESGVVRPKSPSGREAQCVTTLLSGVILRVELSRSPDAAEGEMASSARVGRTKGPTAIGVGVATMVRHCSQN